MAIETIYFIDGATFDVATSVYLSGDLSLIAPDGVYKFGTITRQQSSGVLLAVEACSSCGTPCGEAIGGSGGTGIYQINLDVGSTLTNIGAIIIKFDPSSVPDGIRATYDGIVYNKLSSPVDGLHQSSNYGEFTVVGALSKDCGLTGNTTVLPSIVEYLYNGTSFVATGGTQSVTISRGDVSLGSSPGQCVMVIPKPNATPNNVFIEIIGPCGGTAWNFSAECSASLPSFASSAILVTYPGPILCSIPMDQTYYYAKVNTASPDPIGKDYVFIDANGQFPLPDGYYVTSYDGVTNVGLINVSNGVILNRVFTNCI